MERIVRIGVVTAWPEDDWHSRRLLAAFERRAETWALDPAELAAAVGPAGLSAGAGGEPMRMDALVLVRGLGRSGDADVQFALYRTLEEAGALLVNRIQPLLDAQDKFRTSWLLQQAGVPTPRAAVAQTPDDAEAALAALGDAVVKPVAGSLGDGVERLGSDPAGRRGVRERAARDGAVYLQAFAPNPGHDLRVFVVGGEARAAITRRAPPGEWRSNVAGGARPEAAVLPAAAREAAEAAARTLGLDYAGIDVLLGPAGPTVIEVNGNPSWQGIHEATGLDMAEAIADHVMGRALRRRKGGDHTVREWTGATNG